MAKSDSFFIRASNTCGNTFNEIPIDLGAYVSALGKSVLKIKSVHYEWLCGPNAGSPQIVGGAPAMLPDEAGEALMQLTTQTQTGIVGIANKSVIAKAQLWARNPDDAADGNAPSQTYNDSHSPQDYADSYIVAVETMYLGCFGGTEWTTKSDLTCNVMIECQVETLTQASAMALALSQQ